MPPPMPKMVEINPTPNVRTTPSQRLNWAVAGSKSSGLAVARFDLDFRTFFRVDTSRHCNSYNPCHCP